MISNSFKLANGTVVMVFRESLENSSGLIPSLQSFNFAITVDQCFRASAVQTLCLNRHRTLKPETSLLGPP